MKVLHVTSDYYPATYWGGPIFSTLSLCNGIARHSDVTLRVLTTDTAGPSLRDRVEFQQFPEIYPPGYEVYFTRRRAGLDISPGLLRHLLPMVRWADVVHLTGNYHFPCLPTMLACRLLCRPLVWSPRGTLQATQEWNAVRRPGAKQIFDWIACRVVPSRSAMHVTSEMERQPSQERIPGPPTVVIPNVVEVPETLEERTWRPGGRLRLMFISRLDPKKGLENLFKAMAGLPGHVSLSVFGTGKAEYIASLEKLACDLGISARVTFHGHVSGAEKTAAFTEADVFVLPSHSENFGMAVAEALAHGVPVITSRATPWRDIERIGCGRWIDNAPQCIAEAIRQIGGLDLAEMGRRGRTFIGAEFGLQPLSDRMIAVYHGLLAGQFTSSGSGVGLQGALKCSIGSNPT